MHSIEVDFEVFKQLTNRRETEEVSYNDVIRELLGLGRSKPPISQSESPSTGDWVVKGVRFPSGTDFRGKHKGQSYTARVQSGTLFLSNGKSFDSPSAAAVSITGGAVNGWRFWECRLPGKASWQLIESLRR